MLSLLATASNMSEVDGADLWRQKSLKSLTDFIQGKIHEMQHPEDCRKARILLCNLDKSCGFGCEMHHVAFCFMTAFGSQRTMVFDGDGNGWRLVHNDLTKFYTQTLESVSNQFNSNSNSFRPEFLPLSIPRPISEELLKLHSNPPVFFIGQCTAISVPVVFDEKRPIVGLQIRRTDKIGTEAAFHDVDEYIQWAEIWYKVSKRRDGNITRRVFVATDEPSVFLDIKRKFPHYEVYGDEETAKTAQLASRYTDSSLYGVIRDVRLLSLCNYIVCTFSSQVCRMGFELMQVQQGDAGDRFHSLDDVYYFGGQHAHEVVAVENHDPEKVGEIELRIGDVVGIAGNHWNGFSKGHNRRTGDSGFYPSYKVSNRMLTQPVSKNGTLSGSYRYPTSPF
uniref:GT23 domain-containing protein n=1 Tax=Angiostrongylus cantonensis TaxID=6313 RepID=A0A0K0CSW3_ANGCA